MADKPTDPPQLSEEEMLKQWQNMAANEGTADADPMAAAMGLEGQKILDQN
ncbi:MAG: hypothetical protein INF43_02325, partial [Alphaproteobacteria bacterium]|nr:hypothetical protein [Alphaproteobacteria bacterium]